ncbi:MAG: hypothetical protein ACI8XO_003453 [Verrucomicrobiales bacterium]|jgi:hypothetical protein
MPLTRVTCWRPRVCRITSAENLPQPKESRWADNVGGNHRWPAGTYKPGLFEQRPAPRRGSPIPFHELYELQERIFQDHVTYQQTVFLEQLQGQLDGLAADAQLFSQRQMPFPKKQLLSGSKDRYRSQ